jgi:ABC-type polysaccharide/polyol phosphate export permease
MPVRNDPAPPEELPHQTFEPHRAGLPNLIDYFSDLWKRRSFAAEMSRATMRGSNTNTFFGQAWMVLNPLMLACVYFVLVMIIRGGRGGMTPMETFAHLTGNMFLFHMMRNAANTASKSITTSGKMLLNTNFPRLLIPLSTVRTAFFRFLPTIPLYLLFHLAAGQPWTPKMLLSVFFIATVLVFTMGVAAIVATLNVYFRDTGSFLPYVMRMWMYLSPVLWTAKEFSHRFRHAGQFKVAADVLVHVNPMYSMLNGYSDLLMRSAWPTTYTWITAAGWALASVIVGFLFFMARERDFTVRVL